MKRDFRVPGIFLLVLSIILFHSCNNEKPATPVITTAEVTEISFTHALSGGELISEGDAPVLFGGVCWDTMPDPTIVSNKSVDSLGIGPFTSNITMLDQNTLYYVRAYAISKIGPGYGNEVTFTTSLVEIPVLTTAAFTSVSCLEVVSGGNISADNGGPVTSKGVCWNTTGIPTIADNKTSDGTGTGMYKSSITGLASNTVYYLRAYATNSAGTGYGNELTVILYMNMPGAGVTDGDGNIYKTVKIGNQEWMAENLKLADGIRPSTDWEGGWGWIEYGDRAYGWYNDDIINKDIYGALYTWDAVMNGAYSTDRNPSGIQGICPAGWHIPSNSEWAQLEAYLGGSSIAGGKLKETGTAHWIGPNAGATNESGFTALPGGVASRPYPGYYSLGSYGTWISTSTGYAAGGNNYLDSYVMQIRNSNAGTARYQSPKRIGRSVRCLKD